MLTFCAAVHLEQHNPNCNFTFDLLSWKTGTPLLLPLGNVHANFVWDRRTDGRTDRQDLYCDLWL